MKTYIKINKALSGVFAALAYGAGAVGALMMLLSVANVVARQIIHAPIFGTVEIVSYAGMVLGVGALAYNELGDGNITMTLFTDMMKLKPKSALGLFTNLIAAVFYAAICKRYYQEIFVALRKATTTQTIMLPMWIVNAFMCVGFAFGTLALILKAVRCLAYLIWGDALLEAQKPEKAGGDKA